MLFALLLFLLGFSAGQESLSSCDTNGAFPDPDQCDKYWECRGGNLTSHLCPDGLVYDLTTSVASFQVGTGAPPSDGSRCSYPFAIDCTSRTLLQPPQPRDNCPRQNGYFPVDGTCDQYWFCGGDKPATIHICPVTLVFAPDQGRCTWKGEANRPDCEEADTFHQDFLCPESGFGEYLRYPDPADCRAYYVCVQGAASRSICPAGQAFHPTSVACSEEQSLPAGLCAPGKLWEDRNSTGSGAPTIKIPKTRTRNPVRKPTRNRVKEPFQNFPAGGQRETEEGNQLGSFLSSSDGEDGRVALECVSCRQANPLEDESVRLDDNSVLVGQQKAREKTLFLDAEGKTTTTPIPRRLRTRTRIKSSAALNRAQLKGGNTVRSKPETKSVVPRRRTRVRGRIGSPRSEENGGAEEKPLVRLQKDERNAVGSRTRVRSRTRMRGSVRRPQQQQVVEQQQQHPVGEEEKEAPLVLE